MKQLLLLGLLSFSFCPLSFADDTPPPAKTPAPPPVAAPAPAPAAKSGAPVQVQVFTSMGNFVIELNAERAPLTVAHFLKLVDEGHFTGTIFHRVVPNFVIQAGGFDSSYKPTPPGTKVVNESGNGLSNTRTTVGMARGSEPHGADGQFYVNLYDNAALDPNQTRWGYAVFGKVVSGMEVVDRIGNVATGSHGPIKEDTPLKPVVIQKIERIAAP
jgi:peptidyl-prolyl cis-trans isomerase A (cyclophilin A)/peptidyl-prolyl cis-trans isomerase B (cyclophilin B)